MKGKNKVWRDATLKSEPKSESSELTSESKELKSEASELKCESSELKSESNELNSELSELKSQQSEWKPEENKSDLKSDSNNQNWNKWKEASKWPEGWIEGTDLWYKWAEGNVNSESMHYWFCSFITPHHEQYTIYYCDRKWVLV